MLNAKLCKSLVCQGNFGTAQVQRESMCVSTHMGVTCEERGRGDEVEKVGRDQIVKEFTAYKTFILF